MVNTDIVVIGGGPAGLATAIKASRKGFKVRVYDGIIPPADKPCGEGLMPDALAALACLGIHISGADSFPFRGIRFLDRGVAVAASFPSGTGRGVRRTTLHRIMVETAEGLGVKLHWGTHVDLDSLRCGWIVGADGESSSVRKWAGLDTRMPGQRRFGFRQHYRIEPWSDYMEIHWGEGYQVYVTPVTKDSVCVAVISRDSQFRLFDSLQDLPELARRLKPNSIITNERGAVCSTRRLKAVSRGRVALAGEASGSVDAITGEGLCLAFRQASAVVDAIECGDLSQYEWKHRQMGRRARFMAKVLVAMGDNATFRRMTVGLLALYPELFAKFLTVHIGALYEINCSNPINIDPSVRAGEYVGTRSRANSSPVHVE